MGGETMRAGGCWERRRVEGEEGRSYSVGRRREMLSCRGEKCGSIEKRRDEGMQRKEQKEKCCSIGEREEGKGGRDDVALEEGERRGKAEGCVCWHASEILAAPKRARIVSKFALTAVKAVKITGESGGRTEVQKPPGAQPKYCPNTTVCIEVPPRLSWIKPIHNVLNLKPYHERPPDLGPTNVQAPPDLIDGEDEFQVEVDYIIAHCAKGKTSEYSLSQIRVLRTQRRPVVAREELDSCS
eukprot:2648338-Rhodomonas_salina.2